ncbi:MAG: NAD-dependent epimerase/dehydratase family protein [Anaerolineales bacterium]|uniref:NAD-dependent epimerase/dehydratase family protein n=1 Tax=Candidatus Villigracilis proximus TaxID=3140683 RepID=UPI00313577E2|nr:NAD-dependent epimerase/dehydratase family protein [Anaerolineales bacterium]
MKILIIGGTRFVGRHLVNAARARGHEVTLFNRGQSNPNLFGQVEKIRGDRERDLDQLTGTWDAVIDTCGYFPRIVRMSAEALRDKVERYVFISSISVYSDFSKIGINESDPVGKIEDESVEDVGGGAYGPLKALCEKTVQDVFGIDSLIIRPGLIVGPHDPTDRFTYWPVRVARGGDVLAPEKTETPIQIVDVRDLSDFIIELIQQNVSGVFNATGPDHELTLGALLDTCKLVSASDAKFKWASVEFLEKNKVAAWSDMPVWVPDNREDAGFARVDISKAVNAGLKFTPLEQTARDTIQWASERPENHEWKAGLSAEREAELLRLMSEE